MKITTSYKFPKLSKLNTIWEVFEKLMKTYKEIEHVTSVIWSSNINSIHRKRYGFYQ